MLPEPIIEFDQVEKSFFGVKVLRGVSFAVGGGRIVGLVGENGAGKSTLMNILGGVIPFDGGRLLLNGQEYTPRNPSEARAHGVAFIHQELNLFANLSIGENIFLHGFPKHRTLGLSMIDRKAMREKTGVLLETLGLRIDPDALVETLSPGERQLVEIAKALSVDAKIIIFDEPTTSLTTRESERLFQLLDRFRSQGIGIIYISHNLTDVLRLCDDIVVLRDGAVVGQGAKSEFTEDRMITLMVGRTLDQLFPDRSETPTDEAALEVQGLTQSGRLRDISFRLQKGEILGVAGLMGAGRSELARALFGLDPIDDGEILFDGVRALPGPQGRIRQRVAFLTEDRRDEGLMMEAGVAENVALASLRAFSSRGFGMLNRTEMNHAVARVTDAVKVKGASQQRVKSLSGGNQQKVVFAKWLLESPSVFILDEPTRGVDVGAKSEIYRLIVELASKGTGVLLISSEIEELIGLSDRILVLSGGSITDSVPREEFDRERILRSALIKSS